ncbi:hypothetical protein GCM10010442_59170 [Kitasatospora kifunensis]
MVSNPAKSRIKAIPGKLQPPGSHHYGRWSSRFACGIVRCAQTVVSISGAASRWVTAETDKHDGVALPQVAGLPPPAPCTATSPGGGEPLWPRSQTGLSHIFFTYSSGGAFAPPGGPGAPAGHAALRPFRAGRQAARANQSTSIGTTAWQPVTDSAAARPR